MDETTTSKTTSLGSVHYTAQVPAPLMSLAPQGILEGGVTSLIRRSGK